MVGPLLKWWFSLICVPKFGGMFRRLTIIGLVSGHGEIRQDWLEIWPDEIKGGRGGGRGLIEDKLTEDFFRFPQIVKSVEQKLNVL